MVILDASVVTKWFKPDEKSEAADNLLKEHLAGRDSIFVPPLLLYEFTNALWYSKRLTGKEIERAIELLDTFKVSYINPDRGLLSDALIISEAIKLSIYDASYVALSRRFSCRLFTADKKLYERAKNLARIVLI